MKKFIKSLLVAPLVLCASSAMAVPVLQLGSSGDDVWDATTETWLVNNDFIATSLIGGEAYLVFAAVPMTASGDGDVFDITVNDGDGDLVLFEEAYGRPPFSDSNSLAPHGIFDTWIETYTLNFNGPLTTVMDTQPGEFGTADGYIETLTLTINSSLVPRIHIDLYTVDSEGQVTHFAPFSHDATYVPVPAAVWLFGSGLIGLVAVARRRKNV